MEFMTPINNGEGGVNKTLGCSMCVRLDLTRPHSLDALTHHHSCPSCRAHLSRAGVSRLFLSLLTYDLFRAVHKVAPHRMTIAKRYGARKRPADDEEAALSLPPLKRSIKLATNATKVATFSTPTSHKPPQRMEWREGR